MRQKQLKVLQCRIISKEEDKLSCFLETLEEGTNKRRKQHIIIDENRNVSFWNCTCSHGSVWRFSKKWLGLDKKCQHVEKCIAHLEMLGYFYI